MSSVNMPQTQAAGSNQFGQGTNSSQGSNPYVNANKRDIGGVFNANIDLFRDPDTGKVTQEQLREIANRPMTGRVAEDNMTMLANEVLRRPELNSKLVPKSEWEPPKTDEKNKELPVGGKGDGLQRQRVENSDKGTGQANPYADKSSAQLADYALARFSSLADADGAITDKSLASVASGTRSDGTPASKSEISLANALLDQPGLFSGLDGDESGKFDGKISRDDLAAFKYESMKPDELLKGIKEHFSDIWEGGDKDYLNVGELEWAAGIKESPKTYTPEVRALAKELLARPQLLRELDIGVKTATNHKAGTEDGRFDMINLDYLIEKYASSLRKAA
ncbi:hypothetical protein [Pseudomonas sp. PAMC 25886]|jgi:hypothetical protein|uniref:hypothetical protein n=1 Tax=Pseudomonas sp. PAMC 25886 TaxID=1125977 RepID=UPI000288055C|nr:hypothetical protein [Pseudomonas sp. PAMC 25886]